MNWKFCPDCGTKFEAAHKFCAECGKKRDAKAATATLDPQSVNPLLDLVRQYGEQAGKLPAPKRDPQDYFRTPQVIPLMPTRRCAYEGLPNGVYGLYCGCPKCSPQCSTNSYTLRGGEQITKTVGFMA